MGAMDGAMDAVVRAARHSDVKAMVEIYAPIVRDTAISFEMAPPGVEELSGRLARIRETDPWLVLDAGGEIAGYAYASPFKPRPAYDRTRETTVYVHPGHRSAGVGRRLLSALLDELESRGDHLAVAFVTLPNDSSVRLHEGLGYRCVGVLSEAGRKFDRWHDVGIWQRRLAGRTQVEEA